MTTNDGGLVFPSDSPLQGMSLRDWFAGMAMTEFMSGDEFGIVGTVAQIAAEIGVPATEYKAKTHWPLFVAKRSYEMAQVMLDERDRRYGQNSVDSTTDQIPKNNRFIVIAAGRDHSLGLKTDGSIVGWGGNSNGQCNVPTPNSGFIAVSAGNYHSLGLKADGSIVAWGYNQNGQCNVPTLNNDFVAIAAGDYHSLGLKADGSVVSWGFNYYGQCNVPTSNSGFIAIAAGVHHSLGLKADGSIVAQGDNRDGQCNV